MSVDGVGLGLQEVQTILLLTHELLNGFLKCCFPPNEQRYSKSQAQEFKCFVVLHTDCRGLHYAGSPGFTNRDCPNLCETVIKLTLC